MGYPDQLLGPAIGLLLAFASAWLHTSAFVYCLTIWRPGWCKGVQGPHAIVSPTPPHHTAVGHTPLYRHTYAQWLAPASGGTLDISYWISWVSSIALTINSI